MTSELQDLEDNINFLVPKDLSYEQFIARALDVSRACNSWEAGMIGTDSFDSSVVIDLASEIYFSKG
jgi:hypothetical protein